jgi:hypothetical protein
MPWPTKGCCAMEKNYLASAVTITLPLQSTVVTICTTCLKVQKLCIFPKQCVYVPVPRVVWSKAWVCGRSLTRIVGSNPTGDMDVCLLWVLCVVRQRSLRRAGPRSGVLSSVVCPKCDYETSKKWGGLGPQGLLSHKKVYLCVSYDSDNEQWLFRYLKITLSLCSVVSLCVLWDWNWFLCIFVLWRNSPTRAKAASLLRFRDHTQTHHTR